jgi:hypothetical protein
MPANTSPDNIVYPVSTDPVAPLETVFANMANSVQDAFDGFRGDWNNFEVGHAIKTYRWADATERTSQTGMQAGDVGYQEDTGVQYQYSGSAWVALPGGATAQLVKNSTTWSFPNSALTQLISTYFDTDVSENVTVTTGSDTRLTIVRPGRYRVYGQVTFSNNATGARLLLINKNSTTATTNTLAQGSIGGFAAASSTVAASRIVSLATGDVIRFFGFQNSGGSLNLTAGIDASSHFGIEYVGG